MNEITPKQKAAASSYVLIGYGEGKTHDYVVRFVVNEYSNEVDSVDVLYAVNTKREPAGITPGGHIAAPPTGSKISIRDLLDYVNRNYPHLLPEDVLKHYGYDARPEGDLSEDILYQSRDADIAKSVTDYFGTTYSWNETGYITTDGKRLDFSGKRFSARGGYRTIDHREVLDGYPAELQDDFNGGTDVLNDFMQRGNIRIMPESSGINLATMPTDRQKSMLRDYISRERGEIALDIDDSEGNTVVSVEYPRGTSSSKILNDISEYFENGTQPTVSEYGRYRYQDRFDDLFEIELSDDMDDTALLRHHLSVNHAAIGEIMTRTREECLTYR